MQPEYQKSTSPDLRIDVFGYLSVRRLMTSEGAQSGTGGGDQAGLTARRHAEGTDRRIAAEDAGVVAPGGPLAGGAGENAGDRAVAMQQIEGTGVADIEK